MWNRKRRSINADLEDIKEHSDQRSVKSLNNSSEIMDKEEYKKFFSNLKDEKYTNSLKILDLNEYNSDSFLDEDLIEIYRSLK